MLPPLFQNRYYLLPSSFFNWLLRLLPFYREVVRVPSFFFFPSSPLSPSGKEKRIWIGEYQYVHPSF